MSMGIVATGDKAWAPSSGTLRSEFFEDVDNEIPEKNEDENLRNDAARLSRQIEKLCNAADNMSQATSSLTPIMDPYGIPQADCIGAIDGTHIAAILPRNEQCVLTQNVMAVYANIIDPEDMHDGENDDDDSGGESNNSSGFEMELTRD
ncbi:hypothetical protein Goshw_020203, partial [Gossypium schwendimanii]|nr:hypothetical protein [Gossypium schwendimanii]